MPQPMTVTGIRKNIMDAESKVYDVVQNSIYKIRKLNKKSNAFIHVFEKEALGKATELDKKIAKGEKVGALCGVPLGIKDNIYVKSFRTTAATKLFENFIPKSDAEIISRLRRLDSILMGKTNLHALALGATSTSSLFGPVKNPYDPKRTSGGSSGGTAAAVAQGMVAAGLGTDTGGSVRIPAAFCGLVGFKPTCGLVSTEGVIPLSYTLDHVGFLANTSKDCHLLLKSVMGSSDEHELAGEDSFDPSIKIGLPKEYCEDLDPKVERDFHRVLDKLKSRGTKFVDVKLPDPAKVHEMRSAIMLKEAASIYSEAMTRQVPQFPPDVMGLLTMGLSTTNKAYFYSLGFRAKAITQQLDTLSRVDFIAMPTIPIVAPKLDEVLGNERGPARAKLVRNTGLFNLTGFPALTLPLGGENGLFSGFQLTAKPLEDEKLLAMGAFVESLD